MNLYLKRLKVECYRVYIRLGIVEYSKVLFMDFSTPKGVRYLRMALASIYASKKGLVKF